MAELERGAISTRMGQSREAAGLTQPEIAELLQPPVHFRSVQDWESPRKHVVPFDRLDEWARLTNTSREWLLYGEDAVKPDLLAEFMGDLADTLATRHDEAVSRFDALDEQLRVLAATAAEIRSRLE